MATLADKDKETARRKMIAATAATAGSVALIATGVAPILGVLALIPSAYLVKDWFMYRAKRGMKF